MDISYLAGLLVVWYGNLAQILHIRTTHSTRSITLWWPAALLVSFGLRLPRSFASEFWVWKAGYVASILLMCWLVATVVYYRRKYKGV